MNIRQQIEQREVRELRKEASLAMNSKGRRKKEEPCDLRTCYQRDRDRIIHSKAFRRLKHKTQVFISPLGDHYRTRLTHTLEVSQIARTIARGLFLNEDLVEAMSLGHDVGHTPFGHCGESVLNRIHPDGFKHYEQSLRVLDYLEKNDRRQGLNLTEEVRDGILNHSGNHEAHTLEGRILKYADRIAYVNHDIDDALRAGVLRKSDLPKDLLDILGHEHGVRIDTLVRDLIEQSTGKDELQMSPEIEEAFMALRAFMFRNVYTNPTVKEETEKLTHMIEEIYFYYRDYWERVPESHRILYEMPELREDSIDTRVCDYIAGMTDQYLVELYKELFLPKAWSIRL